MSNFILNNALLSTLLFSIIGNVHSMNSINNKENNKDEIIMSNIKYKNIKNQKPQYKQLMVITNQIFERIIMDVKVNITNPLFNFECIALNHINNELVEFYNYLGREEDTNENLAKYSNLREYDKKSTITIGYATTFCTYKRITFDKTLEKEYANIYALDTSWNLYYVPKELLAFYDIFRSEIQKLLFNMNFNNNEKISCNQFLKYISDHILSLKNATLKALNQSISSYNSTTLDILNKTLLEYRWENNNKSLYKNLIQIINKHNSFGDTLFNIKKLQYSKDITNEDKKRIDNFIYTALYFKNEKQNLIVKEAQRILNKLVQLISKVINKTVLSNDENKLLEEKMSLNSFYHNVIKDINKLDLLYFSNSSLQSDFNILHNQIMRDFNSKSEIIKYVNMLKTNVEFNKCIGKIKKILPQYNTTDLIKVEQTRELTNRFIINKEKLFSLLSTLKIRTDNIIQKQLINMTYVPISSSLNIKTIQNAISDYLEIAQLFMGYLDYNSGSVQKLYQFGLKH